MKELIGVLICLGAIFLGVYLGGWILFIGGIVQVIEAIKIVPVDAMGIAVGIFKIWVSGLVGWLSFIFLFAIGQAFLEN